MQSRRTRLVAMLLAVACLVTGCEEPAPARLDPTAEPFDVRFQESRFYRQQDKFPPEDDPQVVAANEAVFLREDDEVLGFVIGGQSRAYSVRALCYHHVVNDRIGDTPIVITYCVVCSSGIAYDPVCRGQRLTFGFHGIWQGTAVLYDRQTQSRWLHLTGECVEGTLKGEHLRPIAGRHLQWSEWKRDHPQSQVMAENPAQSGNYFSRESARRGLDFFPRTFPPTIQVRSDRLPASTLCFGVATETAAKAYPFPELSKHPSGVINDVVGETPVVIASAFLTQSTSGHSRVLGGQTLEFTAAEKGLLRERATGSLFNADGQCVEGAYVGRRLPGLNSLQAEWYGWYAAHPDTAIWKAD